MLLCPDNQNFLQYYLGGTNSLNTSSLDIPDQRGFTKGHTVKKKEHIRDLFLGKQHTCLKKTHISQGLYAVAHVLHNSKTYKGNREKS